MKSHVPLRRSPRPGLGRALAVVVLIEMLFAAWIAGMVWLNASLI
ncbi:hypothetical protein [Nocardia brasiliensis]|nr:hypothetical protein [Nocardia brasiliensis]